MTQQTEELCDHCGKPVAWHVRDTSIGPISKELLNSTITYMQMKKERKIVIDDIVELHRLNDCLAKTLTEPIAPEPGQEYFDPWAALKAMNNQG